MPQQDVDVCNLAIGKAGGEPIEEIGEDTPLGAHCQQAYPQCRDWLLSKHRWAFAKRVKALNRLTDAPTDWPLTYAFAAPGDLVGAIHAYREGAREDTCTVRVLFSGDGLASDAPSIWAEYTCAAAPATWPAWFTELVATALAVDLARKNQNRTLANDLFTTAFGTVEENFEGGLYGAAVKEDGRNAPQRQLSQDSGWDDGPLVGARFGAGLPGVVTVRVEN